MTDLRVVGGDLVPPAGTRRHLLSIGDLTRGDVDHEVEAGPGGAIILLDGLRLAR